MRLLFFEISSAKTCTVRKKAVPLQRVIHNVILTSNLGRAAPPQHEGIGHSWSANSVLQAHAAGVLRSLIASCNFSKIPRKDGENREAAKGPPHKFLHDTVERESLPVPQQLCPQPGILQDGSHKTAFRRTVVIVQPVPDLHRPLYAFIDGVTPHLLILFIRDASHGSLNSMVLGVFTPHLLQIPEPEYFLHNKNSYNLKMEHLVGISTLYPFYLYYILLPAHFGRFHGSLTQN